MIPSTPPIVLGYRYSLTVSRITRWVDSQVRSAVIDARSDHGRHVELGREYDW